MSKFEKLLLRSVRRPRDFSWDELVTLLKKLGDEEQSGAGSRRKFVNEKKEVISLHKPHSGSILKRYMIDIVIEHLKEKGKI